MNLGVPAFRLRFVIVLITLSISSFVSAQWVRKADALKPRSEMGETVVYNNKLYAFVGFTDSSRVADPTSELYDPATNIWSAIAPMQAGVAMTHEDIILIDNTIWLIDGRVGKNPGPVSNAIWIYHINSNSWSKGPDIKDPATGKDLVMGATGSVLLGRTLHIFGGFTPTACTNDQDKYHLTLDVDSWLANSSQPAQWKNELKPLPLKRNHISALVLGGKIYAIGGQTDHDCTTLGKEVAYCHVYNPATDTWTQLPSLPTGRSHAEGSTFAIDGKIYMLGGQGSDGKSSRYATIFDPEANGGKGTWTENSSLTLPAIYEGCSATVIGTTLILSHGSQGSSKFPSALTYTRTIARNPVYNLGFPAECLQLSDASATMLKGHTWLFTIDGTKTYTTSSSASWLTVTKNPSGTTSPNAADIEVTANTNGLANGSYNATVTATGTGGGTSYAPATLCVHLVVNSGAQASQYNITVNTSGNGSVTKSPDQAAYNNGSVVTLSANPGAGQQFTGWSGSAAGTANPLKVTMNSNKTITANFQAIGLISNLVVSSSKSYVLAQLKTGMVHYTDRDYTVTSVPSFLNLAPMIRTPNDDKVSTAASLVQFNLAQSATVYVAYDPRATALPAWLHGWQKSSSALGITDATINFLSLYSKVFPAGKVVLGGNRASPAANALNNYLVMAVAQSVQYGLNIFTTGTGSVTKDPDQNAYNPGAMVTLTASPGAGQQFLGWSGSASGINNPLVVTMDAAKSITASFTTAEYNLQVTSNGNGSVIKDPDQATFASGSIVSLTAVPSAGQQFTGWSGNASGTTNPLTVVMNGDKDITASFSAVINQYNLDLAVNGNGSVDNDPEQSSYIEGSDVVLTATPAEGEEFLGWSGDESGTTNPLTITMDAGKMITANFSVNNFAVSSVVASTGGTYALSRLAVDTIFYTDRDYAVTSVPASLEGAWLIKTPNDDKASKTASVLSFAINQSVDIFVAYDPRETSLPAWLSGWQKLQGEQIGIEDNVNPFMDLYNKSYPAGTVMLGGNMQSPAQGAKSNYFVIVKPQQISGAAHRSSPAVAVAGRGEGLASSREVKAAALTFRIYPNPSHGNKIHVEGNNFSKHTGVSILIKDAQGNMVQKTNIVTDELGVINIDIVMKHHFSKGLYTLSVIDEIKSVERKIVID